MRLAVPAYPGSSVWKRIVAQDLSILTLSLGIQLSLALLFGHFYDMRIYMATGYLVAAGQNPYIPQDLTAVFNNNYFQGMTSIGYPPPWALILGVIYRAVYPAFPNLLIYNLAIKIPIILANLGLAYLVARILTDLGTGAATARKAWIFMLLNPFLFYFASAWGQFDSIVALLALLSLVLLHSGMPKRSAFLLALAIAFKPIALPILPVALVYLLRKPLRPLVHYSVAFLAALVLFCVAPFWIFGWDPSPIFQGWNAHFVVGGGMSWMSFYEYLKDSYQLPGQWWLLGLVWVPALGIAAFALKPGNSGFVDLIKKSTGLILVFFLTRAWLSEPNLILILPFVLILTSIGELKPLFLAAVCLIPLIFTVFNASPPQLLFPGFPEALVKMLIETPGFRDARLLIRTAWAIPWLIAGWWMVFALFRKNPLSHNPAG